MITFSAIMYNVSSGEYCETTPRNYSFAEYLGYTGEQAASNGSVSISDWWFGGVAAGVAIDDSTGQDVMQFHDGETVTSVPYTRFIVNRGTNIGTWFEYYAKKFYDEMGSWPILRLLRTSSTDTQYIEWNHSNPTTLIVKTDITFVWANVLQWSDAFNNDYVDDRKYNSMFSQVFLKASTKEQLNTVVLCFNGSVRLDESSGTVTTQISYATFSVVMISGPATLISTAGTFLSSKSGRSYYKAYDGPCFAFQVHGQWDGPITFAPLTSNNRLAILTPYNLDYICQGNILGSEGVIGPIHDIYWGYAAGYHYPSSYANPVTTELTIVGDGTQPNAYWAQYVIENSEFLITFVKANIYAYLLDPQAPPTPQPPDTPDIDPDNPPDPDDPPTPIPPDNPDPYYDPSSDPDSPDYNPKKDPDSPEYDPSEPDTPHRPPTTEDGGDPPVKPPVDPVQPPPTPPSHAINSRFVTLYTPSLSQLNDLAAYLWSPAWSIDGFKKIFANPIDCILGLMIFPALVAPSGTKEVNVGNLSTGVTMAYIDNQYVEVNCGSFEVKEYYASYLDYDPYTKIEIYLPYIGTHKLSADDVMNKTIQLKYMIDLLSGACVAFLVVNGTTLYTFTGSCATPIPVSGNDWSNMVNGILSVAGAAAAAVISGGSAGSMAAGAIASSSLFVSSHKEHVRHGGSVASAAGLMSIQKPYLIITHPRQALPLAQNSFQGYPSFITESLGSLSGYTEVESCHLEHIPCTAEELEEIERLLKGGVLF